MEYVINLLEEKLGNLITLRTEDKIYCTDNYSELDFKHEYQLKEAIKILNGETVKLREVCPDCESKLVQYGYPDGWTCSNCDHHWTIE